MLAQIDRDERRIWSVSAYFSSGGHHFDASKICIDAENARLYTRKSL